MQLMATRGLEHGVHQGLGWIPGEVKRLDPVDPNLKVPHMGWNEVVPCTEHQLLSPFDNSQHAYFVHSYHFQTVDPTHTLAVADYDDPITAIVGRDNLIGTQFHPEKSQTAGIEILGKFLRWRP
jgi:glutamine amidotransferase